MTVTNRGDVTADPDLELDFPVVELVELDKKISCPRWVVPVLPDQELERLLIATIDLSRRGLDDRCEPCQRFIRESLTLSFTKILTDDAVTSWKANIHMYIFHNCKLLVELCAVKAGQDCYPLLDMLAVLFNPNNKFNTFNNNRESTSLVGLDSDDDVFARPPADTRSPRGWLVDLIQQFGKLGGFVGFRDRFEAHNAPALTITAIFAHLRPFGLCCEFLTVRTIIEYILPVIAKIMEVLEGLTDDELKKEAKNENKNDTITSIIKGAKGLISRVPGQEETFKQLELFRLKTILRLLQISSFNGKMSALNEVNKVISNVSYNPHRHPGMEEEEWLTAERMTKWIKENHVLEIVLRDSLHQPQYVDKLEKLLRFIIKERALTLEDLDHVWAAQAGKHEAIVKNVHDLLAKLAWDFSPEQLDHLFGCFQASWSTANKKQQEKLLELIRRLAEDDKDGVMANKVLNLFWNLAHSDDVPTDIMDQVLTAHVKILDYSCSQERDSQKRIWLDRCVEELKTNDKWVLPALKQIREICILYEQNPTMNHNQRSHQIQYRQEIINQLQKSHVLVILVSNNLKQYIDKIKIIASQHPDLDPNTYCPDGRYPHTLQVQERLNFLRFLLKDGQLWLCAQEAKQIWKCLAEDGVFAVDREACFKWFSKLMGDEPDLDPSVNNIFFEENILQLDPTLLTESGMKCFERFFKAVNRNLNKLIPKRRSIVMDDPDLIGLDYLWRVITNASGDIANRAIDIMREVTTNLGPRLMAGVYQFHDTFMSECLDRLRTHFDNVTLLMRQDLINEMDDIESHRMRSRLQEEAIRMCRVMKVLQEYVSECDNDFPHERTILPLHRACRGKNLSLTIHITQVRTADDIDVTTHSNETLASLKRSVLRRFKAYSGKLELSINSGEGREPFILTDDKKLLSQLHIRDKMVLTGKLPASGSVAASSPDSSSDSSTSCAQHAFDAAGGVEEVEATLPGVLLSRKGCVSFFFQLSDLGCSLEHAPLRDGARHLLQLIPPDSDIVKSLHDIMADPNGRLEPIFSGQSPTQILYYAEVLYALLMPAADPSSVSAFEFQSNFIRNGHATVVLDVLTKVSFLENADVSTKRATYISILRICKLILSVVGHVLFSMEGEDELTHQLRRAVQTVLSQSVEPMLRSVANNVANSIVDQLRDIVLGPARSLFEPALNWSLPGEETIRSIMCLAWAASTGSLADMHRPQELHAAALSGRQPDVEDVLVNREALQLLTLSLVLHPSAFERLLTDQLWHNFVIDILLLARNRSVRIAAADQLFNIAMGSSSPISLQLTTSLLFGQLTTTVMEYTNSCNEYFVLLTKLLTYAELASCPVPEAEQWLEMEIAWLRTLPPTRGSDHVVDEAVLEGRLNLTRELLRFTTPERKYDLGSNENKGGHLVKELVEDFIFPASKQMVTLARTRELSSEPLTALCTTPETISAAFDVLVALCTHCVANLRQLVAMLTEMFYSGRDKPLMEWDYLPPLGPRPPRGFVGLKNAGATCYMNSVLQQLFMVESIRTGVLGAEGASNDVSEELAPDVESGELEGMDPEPLNNKSESRKDYNIGILKQVQVIFGHLACSQLQYYVPRGLWRHFRLQGEPVNVREQQDAVEFFMSLVESIDEAMKALGQEQIMTKILGGSYSDQKICKGCPHRYAKEEPFSVISVDIRNHSTLLDSLEQYVKGELLEGADAYHCDNCNKKRVTVKRLCVKKLPPVLAIQLKRFEYDFDRVCAIKFNDYFEFPRDLDMNPYTVSGLAKLEGELIDCDSDEVTKDSCTKYQLTGIVVHSGQASGGHYYSFILHRLPDGTCKWYKFDDGDVSEWKMDDEEEMKTQCFGGDYMGEVFDNMLKRTSYRRQKRWWNAYMLYYTRLDAINLHETRRPKMPLTIERGVRRQNINFMHDRNQFCPEYFKFIRRLLHCKKPLNDRNSGEAEELSMLTVQLASRFLFHTGFHTKKSLRGPAMDWYDLLTPHLSQFPAVRRWFAVNILFQQPHRFSEYLLGTPPAEVRTAFTKLIVFLAHFTLMDGPSNYLIPILNTRTMLTDPDATLSDHLLNSLLVLLQNDGAEHGRYVVHFFSLFLSYAMLGLPEKEQLLKLDVIERLIPLALEGGPDPSDKYQYPEWSKVHQVVSLLVRCCDVSAKCQSSQSSMPPLPNPFAECAVYLMPLPPNLMDLIFVKTVYIKKVLEDPNPSDESIKLIQFCAWENKRFSKDVIMECLLQISYHCQDIKHHLEMIVNLMLLEDTWQMHRCIIALQGEERGDQKRGLLDIIARNKNDYQKRAYQCIKYLTTLFSRCRVAYTVLITHSEIKSKWNNCVDWLQDELERRPYGGNQYSYSNWSPTTQSNDSSNGYFLERSNSARKLLERAIELCPQEEEEVEDVSTGGIVEPSQGGNITETSPTTHLVNANRSYQPPEVGTSERSADPDVAPNQEQSEEGNSDKSSMPAFESAVAALTLQQSK